MDIESRIKKIVSNLDDRGYLISRESTTIEFKENFSFKNLAKYLKTSASFANTKGGLILFGISDSPRKPVGIDRNKFDEIHQEKISTFFSEYFSPEIFWDIGLCKQDQKWFGYLFIEESKYKPVICKKDTTDLKDGAIYYRYRAQSRVISFSELKQIHEELREKERNLWMKHIERISRIGPENIAFIDLFDGAVEYGTSKSKLIIDPELLEILKNNVRFVEEGHFSDNGGSPTLKLIGDLVPFEGVLTPKLDPNKDYPYLAKHLAEELNIRLYDVIVLIWKLDLKSNPKYHIEIQASTNYSIHKYSRFALKLLKETLNKHSKTTQFLREISKEYTKRKV